MTCCCGGEFLWSLINSSTQKQSLCCGFGTLRRICMGFSGILISGRQPMGGGSKDWGDFLAALPFVWGGDNFCGWSIFMGGGGGGKTWKGMPIANCPIGGGGGGTGTVLFGTGDWTEDELLPFVLIWASGETFGVLVTPGLLAFIEILLAILGDFICDKSMPPGVYVKGFLSFVIIAFWTHAGASESCVCSLLLGKLPGQGGGGGTLRKINLNFYD